MAMAELWSGDVMKRKYLTTITFDDNQMMDVDSPTNRSSRSDADGVSYPSESWKTLNLPDVGDIFQVRVLRYGTASAPVPLPFKLSLI